jgi:hypothetical protein
MFPPSRPVSARWNVKAEFRMCRSLPDSSAMICRVRLIDDATCVSE